MAISLPLSEAPDTWFAKPAFRTRFREDSELQLSTAELIHANNVHIKILPTNSRQSKKLHLILRIGELNPHKRLHLQIACGGVNCVVELGDQVSGHWNISLWDKARLTIGSNTDSLGAELTISHGSSVRIGEDCMLSKDIFFQCGDGDHALVNLEKKEQIIKRPASIIIGNHCWIGRKVTLLSSGRKLSIGSGTAIGIDSLVTHSLPECVTAAGSPAKVLRKKVSWTRSRKPNSEEINHLAASVQTDLSSRNSNQGSWISRLVKAIRQRLSQTKPIR